MRPEEVFLTPFPKRKRLADVEDYGGVLRSEEGWMEFLHRRTCAVLLPPWGEWAPYVQNLRPANWSPARHGLQDDWTWFQDLNRDAAHEGAAPLDVGPFLEFDPTLVCRQDLWDWASRPTSTLVLALLGPGESPGGTHSGLSSISFLHYLFPDLGFHVGGPPVSAADLRDAEDAHRPWLRRLAPILAPIAFQPGPPTDLQETRRWRYEQLEMLFELNFEGEATPPAPKDIPKPPTRPRIQYSAFSLMGHPRGDEGRGVSLHARVGEGHLVVVLTKRVNTQSQVATLHRGTNVLHRELHLDHRPSDLRGTDPDRPTAAEVADTRKPTRRRVLKKWEEVWLHVAAADLILSIRGFAPRTLPYTSFGKHARNRPRQNLPIAWNVLAELQTQALSPNGGALKDPDPPVLDARVLISAGSRSLMLRAQEEVQRVMPQPPPNTAAQPQPKTLKSNTVAQHKRGVWTLLNSAIDMAGATPPDASPLVPLGKEGPGKYVFLPKFKPLAMLASLKAERVPKATHGPPRPCLHPASTEEPQEPAHQGGGRGG